MVRTSISEIMTVARQGVGVKISAAAYSASEILSLATCIKPGCYLIITDASSASSAALLSLSTKIKGKVIFDYT